MAVDVSRPQDMEFNSFKKISNQMAQIQVNGSSIECLCILCTFSVSEFQKKRIGMLMYIKLLHLVMNRPKWDVLKTLSGKRQRSNLGDWPIHLPRFLVVNVNQV